MNSASSLQESFRKFEHRAPSHQNAVDIFLDKWGSDFGEAGPGIKAGPTPHFTNDPRPGNAARYLGSGGRLDGMNVLELGPLEAAHTYQLENLGAGRVIAIESNVEAYFKCLIAKEITKMSRAEFLLGDFMEYFKTCEENFDIIFACGVMYHQADPLLLIDHISQLTTKCYVWTHYYDQEHYVGPPREKRSDLRYPGVELFALEYTGMDAGKFWGGNQPTSVWLHQNDIVSRFQKNGFSNIQMIVDTPDHPNGACFEFAAWK